MAEMWISMGPQHPMTHGLWTLKVKVDGETVVDTEPDLGYIHRGVEKICEARDFTQITTYCDRLCYASANTWSHSYIYAAEDLLGVEVPERAEYIRLIAVELQRIASHLMWLGAYGPDIGNLSIMVWCLREREMMMDLLQELGGSRMHYNYPRVGGVKRDIPIGWANRMKAKVKLFENRIKEYEMLLDESTIWLVRLQGVGYATAELDDTTSTSIDNETFFVKYAVGGFTLGYQTHEADSSVAADNDESTSWGISYAVNENMTIAYGERDYDDDTSTAGASSSEQHDSGFSASYTMGGMTIAGHMNQNDNVGGSTAATNDKESYEFALTFAF